jgi:hypothetical protein
MMRRAALGLGPVRLEQRQQRERPRGHLPPPRDHLR